jgi:hypothetical protein
MKKLANLTQCTKYHVEWKFLQEYGRESDKEKFEFKEGVCE